MKLLIIRHAIAGTREEFARTGKDDAQRPLTRDGRRRMRRVAKGLHKLVPEISVIGSSPLVRAAQTAEIVASRYEGLNFVQIAALSPRKPNPVLLNWITQQGPDSTVALVGHEPHLGTFVSWMLTGLQESFIELKKGGACLLEVEGEIRAGRAKLVWLLKPSQIRKLV